METDEACSALEIHQKHSVLHFSDRLRVYELKRFISKKILTPLYLPSYKNKIAVEGVSVPEEEREGYWWLEERDRPEDVAVVGAMYRGPVFVEN